MKIKLLSIGKKISRFNSIPPKSKAAVLAIILLVIFLIAGLIFVAQKNSHKVSCGSLQSKADDVYSLDTHGINKDKAKLSALQPDAIDCKAGQASDQDLLRFYTQMAISSYRFGDIEQAKTYADKSLKVNSKVDDASRGNFFKAKEVQQQMEAVKNGNF